MNIKKKLNASTSDNTPMSSEAFKAGFGRHNSVVYVEEAPRVKSNEFSCVEDKDNNSTSILNSHGYIVKSPPPLLKQERLKVARKDTK